MMNKDYSEHRKIPKMGRAYKDKMKMGKKRSAPLSDEEIEEFIEFMIRPDKMDEDMQVEDARQEVSRMNEDFRRGNYGVEDEENMSNWVRENRERLVSSLLRLSRRL